jgi:hypothetical protein
MRIAEFKSTFQFALHSLKSEILNPKSEIKDGAPGVTRTRDTRIRNPVLYPPELRGQWGWLIGK